VRLISERQRALVLYQSPPPFTQERETIASILEANPLATLLILTVTVVDMPESSVPLVGIVKSTQVRVFAACQPSDAAPLLVGVQVSKPGVTGSPKGPDLFRPLAGVMNRSSLAV